MFYKNTSSVWCIKYRKGENRIKSLKEVVILTQF